ncbi:Uncharacterised protein r2_g1263 [Pycnogonum litorale]
MAEEVKGKGAIPKENAQKLREPAKLKERNPSSSSIDLGKVAGAAAKITPTKVPAAPAELIGPNEKVNIDPHTLIRSLVKTITTERDKWVSYTNEFAYFGFDPLKVYHTLCLKARTTEAVIEDSTALLSLIIMRGTKSTKMRVKMSESGLEKLNILIQKYSIVDFSTSPEAITLGRISIIFAPVIAHLLQGGLGKAIFNPSKFGKNFPRGLAFPGALSIVPSSKEWRMTIAIIKQWVFAFTKLVGSKATLEQIENFFAIQQSSTFFNQEYRVKHMADLEIFPIQVPLSQDQIISGAIWTSSLQQSFGGEFVNLY